jgi:hypothetical protein
MVSVVRGYQSESTSLTRVQFCLFDELGRTSFVAALKEQTT